MEPGANVSRADDACSIRGCPALIHREGIRHGSCSPPHAADPVPRFGIAGSPQFWLAVAGGTALPFGVPVHIALRR
jgi:hypothetical protein